MYYMLKMRAQIPGISKTLCTLRSTFTFVFRHERRFAEQEVVKLIFILLMIFTMHTLQPKNNYFS